MVKWSGTQNKVSVKGECGHPVSVVFQRMERLALNAHKVTVQQQTES
jgi:hypothetical protein